MDRIKKLLNRETILYIVFGAATTVVNYLVFFFFYNVAFRQERSLLANGIAFVAAVIFAFVVNKLFVFESKSWRPEVLRKEIPSFLGGRGASFLIEEAGLFLCQEVWHLGGVTAVEIGGWSCDWIAVAKVALSVLVVILNYVFCKWFVFKK